MSVILPLPTSGGEINWAALALLTSMTPTLRLSIFPGFREAPNSLDSACVISLAWKLDILIPLASLMTLVRLAPWGLPIVTCDALTSSAKVLPLSLTYWFYNTPFAERKKGRKEIMPSREQPKSINLKAYITEERRVKIVLVACTKNALAVQRS